MIEAIIQDKPCLIRVTYYRPARPMKITGWGYGDAEAPIEVDMEFDVLHLDGSPAPELEDAMTENERAEIWRLVEEAMVAPREC